MGKIDLELNGRVNKIIDEMNWLIKERYQVIHGVWVGRIGHLHVVMLGPGGTGKSLLARTVADHITGSQYFECAFDETTDPSQVFGSPDLKAMAEIGRTRRVVDGMLPEATDAFLDEFFNGNTPLLHSVMPILNERVFHDDGKVNPVPLRQAIMGTNKLNADADLAALFDRVHLRYTVDYIKDREAMKEMIATSMARMAKVGRGTSTHINDDITKVTLTELDQAHAEALDLDIADSTMELFLDIKDELKVHGIEISDRRSNEGMLAVHANAWLRGNEEVQPADLDILSTMFWTVQDQQKACRDVVLAAVAPGEKKGMELLDALDELREEIKKVEGEDDTVKRRVGIEQVRNAEKLINEAKSDREKAVAAGQSTQRLDEVIAKGENFRDMVTNKVFGFSKDESTRMAGV